MQKKGKDHQGCNPVTVIENFQSGVGGSLAASLPVIMD